MSKRMCNPAQQILNEKYKYLPSTVVCTAKQGAQEESGDHSYWHKSHVDLWKLKKFVPHLFLQRPIAEASGGRSTPAGFERQHGKLGWWWSSERQVYLEEGTSRLLWQDGNSATYRDLYEAADMSDFLHVSGSAAASSGFSIATDKDAQARHVVIIDLHKAAEAFKLDLSHMERPAAMLAVYGNSLDSVPAEIAARCFHERLIKILCSWRAEWTNDALQAMLVQCFASVTDEASKRQGIAAAVALILGPRVVTARAHGAVSMISELSGKVFMNDAISSTDDCGAGVHASCAVLQPTHSAHCIWLSTDSISDAPAEAARAQAEKGRPRASALSLLQNAKNTQASACAIISWSPEAAKLGNDTKRPRLENHAEERVRCRHILLKYDGCHQPTDPVRKKRVSRSKAQAETMLLEILRNIDLQGDIGFVQQCRTFSECTSCLKGGDLVGDMGWLTRPIDKVGEKLTKEQAARRALIRTALKLKIGELSDLIVSDDGVRIMQRRA